MVLAGEKLFNDLALFLTLTPKGLGLTEIEIVLRMLPTNQSDTERDEKIDLYLTLLRDIAINGA